MNSIVLINDLIKLKHKKQCLEISKEIFGELYHDISFFNADPNFIKLVAIKNKKAIGFLIAYFIDSKKVKLDCVGVAKKFQKQKVGSKLMDFLFNEKISKSVKVIAYAWKNKDGINAKKLNLNYGLKPVKNLGKIWANKCNKSFKCPYYLKTCNCESIEFSS